MDHIHLQLTTMHAQDRIREAEADRLARAFRSARSARTGTARPRRGWALVPRRTRAAQAA